MQFHPVKMLIFVKFSEERWRDEVVKKIAVTGRGDLEGLWD